jgi:hypothetical protein
MLAGTTPGWMRDNIRVQFGGWGIASRIIFVFAPDVGKVVAYPSRRKETWGIEKRIALLLDDLKEISKLKGEYALTEEAFAFGETWYMLHRERQRSIAKQVDASPWLKDFLSRKFDHGNKLAMVLSASRRGSLRIEAPDLAEAFSRMVEVESEMLSIFGTKGERETVSAAARINTNAWRELRPGLVANERMLKTHVHKFLTRYMDLRSAESFLAQLVASGYITQEQDTEGLWITLGSETS